MATSWRDDARQRIQTVLLEYEAQGLLLDEPMGKAGLSKAIAAAYPYGPKTNHPYTQWLKERKLALRFLELMEVGTFGYSARHFGQWSHNQLGLKAKIAAAADGQLSLLDGGAA